MAAGADVDPTSAKAVLEARVNGTVIVPDKINWDVLHGPGEDPAGVYTPGKGDTARFALISATYDSVDFDIFECHTCRPCYFPNIGTSRRFS